MSRTITVPTIGTATGFVATQDYTYDQLNRLATVTEKQYGQTTPDWRQQFGYDPYGNRAMGTGSTLTFGRNSTETQSLIGPDPTVSTSTNRITNKTGEHYEFDASGNMTKDALGNRSVYDIENHQTEYYYATNSGSTPDAKYFYDGDGKRIKKVVGTETIVFVYDAAGKLTAEYTLGITAPTNPQTTYITTDTLGSTRLVTNGAGQVVARHDYLPFGDEIYGFGGRTSAQGFAQPDTTRQRFTGYEHDTETGLDFAEARYYGNGLGRFTGVDPVLESAKATSPQSWNRFIYCINNPNRYVDPSGLSWYWISHQVGGEQDSMRWFKDSDALEEYKRNHVAADYTLYEENTYTDINGRVIQLNPSGPNRNSENPSNWFRKGWTDITDMPSGGGIDMMENQAFDIAAGNAAGKVISTVGGRLLAGLAARFFTTASSEAVTEATVTTCAEPASNAILRFSQRTASSTFHPRGDFSGRSIESVAAELRSGALSPAQVPVRTVEGDGVSLIVNTRTSLALTRAGIPVRSWNLIDESGSSRVMANIASRLARNRLASAGTNELMITLRKCH
jgi:RHS repeat-associated protein